jgi:hypothetical protein
MAGFKYRPYLEDGTTSARLTSFPTLAMESSQERLLSCR